MKAMNFNANMGSLILKDGMPSFRLKVLEEPNQEELYNLSLLQQKELSVFVQPLEGASETIKMENTKDLKSPSARLRGVIYKYWSKSKQTVDSETFYKQKIEQLITFYGSKIDELEGV